MTKEELIQFIKENLEVRVNLDRDEDYLKTEVTISLCGEDIAQASDSTSVKTW